MEHRAPIHLRACVALVAIGAVLANVALLLSDRAPRLLRLMFGDFATRLSRRLDRSGRAGAALDARDVGNDSIVHFGIWAVAAVLVGVAVWSWIGLAVSALMLSAGSVLTEVAQGRYSSTRAVERSDALFNIAGITAGCAAVAMLYLAVETVGRATAAFRQTRQPTPTHSRAR